MNSLNHTTDERIGARRQLARCDSSRSRTSGGEGVDCAVGQAWLECAFCCWLAAGPCAAITFSESSALACINWGQQCHWAFDMCQLLQLQKSQGRTRPKVTVPPSDPVTGPVLSHSPAPLCRDAYGYALSSRQAASKHQRVGPALLTVPSPVQGWTQSGCHLLQGPLGGFLGWQTGFTQHVNSGQMAVAAWSPVPQGLGSSKSDRDTV